MKYKLDIATLVAYLYGDLSKEESDKVKDYLISHPEMKAELDEIKSARYIMEKLEDREVKEPSFVFEEPPLIVVAKSKANFWIKSFISVAASITILMLVGFFTKPRLTIEKSGVSINFGNEKAKYYDANTINKAQVQSWMTDALDKNNNRFFEKINNVENTLSNKMLYFQNNNKLNIKNLLTNYTKKQPKIDQTIIDQYVSQLRDENKDIIRNLVNTTDQVQKQYIDNMIADFTSYLDQQRTNDLDAIQKSFNKLKDHTEINQIETSELLASIISSVNSDKEQLR